MAVGRGCAGVKTEQGDAVFGQVISGGRADREIAVHEGIQQPTTTGLMLVLGVPGAPATLGGAEILTRELHQREAGIFGEFPGSGAHEVKQDRHGLDVPEGRHRPHGVTTLVVVSALAQVAQAHTHGVIPRGPLELADGVDGERSDGRLGVKQPTTKGRHGGGQAEMTSRHDGGTTTTAVGVV